MNPRASLREIAEKPAFWLPPRATCASASTRARVRCPMRSPKFGPAAGAISNAPTTVEEPLLIGTGVSPMVGGATSSSG